MSMAPQLAAGGWMPRPRNDRLASARMALAMDSEICTIREPLMLGSRYRNSTRTSLAPMAMAAATYSRSR